MAERYGNITRPHPLDEPLEPEGTMERMRQLYGVAVIDPDEVLDGERLKLKPDLLRRARKGAASNG